MENVVLVDKNDKEIGLEEKLKAHENGGKLHRAFSVFVFNSRGEMLIQQRAKTKYHFGNLWTNTCCSHPRKGEAAADAAHRRLVEEFGFDADMKEILSFVYRAEDATSGLTEHEFDHVFIGTFNGKPKPNPEEIGDFRWIDVKQLKKDVQDHPEKYTPWFKIVLDRVIRHTDKK